MMENQKSVFDQTMELLDMRMSLYHSYHIRIENEMFKCGNLINTLSDVCPEYKFYGFETPIDPKMKLIYDQTTSTSQMESQEPKKYTYILEPPSDGQNSITSQHSYFQPSFNWLMGRLVDSNLLKLDNLEPKKVQNKIPEEWKGIKEIMIKGLKKKFQIENRIEDVFKFLESRFQKFPWVKLKRCKFLYYKGKSCLLVRCNDQTSAMFAYYNLKKNTTGLREYFGEEIELNRCLENKLKQKLQNWIAILFRKMPTAYSKQHLMAILKKNDLQIIWLEEFVEIEEYKYAIAGVQYLDDALKICNYFRENAAYKQMKVNLHPNSSKLWKPPQLETILNQIP